MVEIRRAITDDYEGILRLQATYYVNNLGEDERRGGFLSAEFSLSQITDMADDLGIVVARDGDRVVGYMCASRTDFEPRPPILDSMFRCLEKVLFRGKVLVEAPMFVYGPVCIDLPYRGRGLLRKMLATLQSGLESRFEVGVAFVAADNLRSLEAHVKGLGMAKVGRFEHGGSRYYVVALAVK
jgi:L-amino acid N-acyltransferase YncA